MIQYSNTGNAMQFHTNGSEKLRITSGGQVNIGGSTQTSKTLYVDGTIEATSNFTCTNQIYLNGTAPQIVFTDTNQDSDYTIKNDFGSLQFIDRTNSNAVRLYANTGGFGGDRLYIADDIVHTGDTDTKIAFTDNQIDLQCAGASRAYINNYGLYIKSGFPLAFLASSGATPNIKSGGTNYQDLLFTTGSGNPTRLQITSGGQILLGGTTSSNTFNGVGGVSNLVVAGSTADTDITDNSGASLTISNTDGTANNTAGLHFAREDNDGAPHYSGASVVAQFKETMNTGQYPKADLAFLTSTANNNAPSEKMRLTAAGQLYVNTSATDTMFGVKNSGTYELITCRNTSNSLVFYVHHSGATYNSGGSYGSISDASLKENIVDANSQWDDIKNIKVRNFNFTEESGFDTHTQKGCVAQELETVSPKLVTTPKEGIKAVAYSVLYMKAVKALQEAQTRIETLEAKVSALEGS